MKSRYFGAAFFVISVTGIVAFQAYRQSDEVQHEEMASTAVTITPRYCGQEPISEPVTADSLQAYLDQYPIKNVRDLVCCLPRSYNKNYTVMHSSFALQAGVPDSPRILMLNSFEPHLPDRSIFSFTGSRMQVHGWDHVEALFHDSKTNRNDLYDIEFSKGRAQLEKNPPICMGCHSPNLKEFPVAGAKPIFQDFPWPGTVGFSLHLDDGEPKKYFQMLENHAVTAMKSDPVYSCLQPLSLRRMGETAELMDAVALEMNDDRVARLIVGSPGYKKIRPLLVGLRRSCLMLPSEVALSKAGLDHFDKEFPRWVAPEVAKKFFSNASYLSPSIMQTDNLQHAMKDLAEETVAAERSIRIVREQRKNDGALPALYFPTVQFSALYNDDPTQFIDVMNSIISDDSYLMPPKTLASYSEPTKLLAHYALDTEKEPHLGLGMDAYFRFLFEARGVSTVTWTKEMAGTHGTTFKIPEEKLQELESDDPFWQQLHTAADPCDFLRKESFKNFSGQ